MKKRRYKTTKSARAREKTRKASRSPERGWGEAPINIKKSTVVPASPPEYSDRESRLGPNKNKPERTQTTPRPPPPPPEAGEDNDTAAE